MAASTSEFAAGEGGEVKNLGLHRAVEAAGVQGQADPRKKYEVGIYHSEFGWRAILICYCGEKPEHKSLWSEDFNELLVAIPHVLAEHESS